MKNESVSSSFIFKVLGQNIRKARLLKGLSQENLSNELDKSLNFISLIETGKKGISIPTLVDICKCLNVSVNTLFDGIFPVTNYDDEKFIIETVKMLNDKDKMAVIYFLKYIIESKT